MRGEYIRRADAMGEITSSETQKALRAMTGEEAYVTVVGILNELPAADVAPVVHGRWGDNGIPDSMLCGCYVCGFTCGAHSFLYCPMCGAKMDGGADDAAD